MAIAFLIKMTTLYIVEHGSQLRVKHQQFQVLQQKTILIKAPVVEIAKIIIFGYCHLSHGAIQTALFRRIPIIYYSPQGYYLGSLQSKNSPQASLVKEQILKAEDQNFVQKQAKIIVRAKLKNSRVLLIRLNGRRPNEHSVAAITELKKIIKCLDCDRSLESLRGYEGNGARIYFRGLSSQFQGVFTFSQRTLRPPKDPINSLLGFGYTLLCQHLISVVQFAGLHPNFGNLHTPQNNHPALVLDLMEEFRAQIVDSLVVYFVNKRIFSPSDFTAPDEKEGVYLKKESLKIFLKHWSNKLSTKMIHPSTGKTVSLRTCLELQVQEYLAYLKGNQEFYRPMLWQK